MFAEQLLGNKSRLVGVFIVAASLVGLAVFGYRSWESVPDVNWTISYSSLLIGFLLYSLTLAATVLGWHLVFDRVAGSRDFRRDAKIYVLSNAAKRLPGGIWGIAGRVYLYKQDGYDEAIVLVAVAVELFAIAAAALVMLPVFAALLPSLQWSYSSWIVWILALVFVFGTLHPRSSTAILNFVTRKLTRGPVETVRRIEVRALLAWLVVYVFVWLLGGGVTFSIVGGLYPVPIDYLPGVVGSWVAAGTMSLLVYFLPGGLGVMELTLSVLLSHFVPAPIAIAGAFGVRIFLTVSELVWALVFLKWG